MEERLRILELIEAGEISVEEGVRRLQALPDTAGALESPAAPADTARAPESPVAPADVAEAVEPPPAPASTVAAPEPQAQPVAHVTRPRWVQWLWQVVFWPAVALVAGGGLLVTAVYAWEVPAGWLVLGWLLFALGVLGVLLGWWMQRAHWFYLRVREPGSNIFMAFPLPLGPIAWLLRIARPFVPQLKETGVDELILAMHEELRGGGSFTVEVNEGAGEQVRIYFG